MSLWIEGMPIWMANASTIAKFLYKNVIYQYSCPQLIIKDSRPENQGIVNKLVDKYGIHHLIISLYHPPINSSIEHSNWTFKESLSKLNNRTACGWTQYWASILFTDHTTAKHPTGMTLYQILYGQEAVLLIELEVPT